MNQMKTLSLGALITYLVGSMTLLSSCRGSGSTFVQASGRPGEVMLVMDNELLDSTPGIQLAYMLNEAAPALPQEEPMFTLGGRVPSPSFKGALQYFRNIIIADVDPERFSTTSLKYGYDEWARGQLIIRLQAAAADSLTLYLKRNQEAILNMLTRHELYRFGSILEEEFSQRATELTDSIFGHSINVPRDIRHHKIGQDFLWMSNAQMRRRHDILVYSFPYRSQEDIGLDRLVEVRDSVLKRNIQGEFEGTYPSTVRTGLSYRKVMTPGQPTRGEIRGLWQMEGGAMMGGPFVCQAYIDKAAARVYVMEGFVYHPNESKLNLIRMMEGSLYSFRPKGKAFTSKQILETTYTKSF